MSTIVHRILVALLLPKRVADLIKYCQQIIAAMTGNSWFPAPNPVLATFTDKVARLDAAETASKARTKGTVAARNVARAELLLAAHALASQVQLVADANPENAAAIITSTAMSTKKTHVRPAPVFGAKYGAVSGSINLVAPAAAKRASYEWQYSLDGGKTWMQVDPTTRARTIIHGLPVATQVLFRYRALTSAGVGDWSQPVGVLVK
jgi:hypothetical protein